MTNETNFKSSDKSATQRIYFGVLALKYAGRRLPLKVMRSQAGYYVGTESACGPCSRESNEYFKTQELADAAIASSNWTQKQNP